jgi:Zn-dependent protease
MLHLGSIGGTSIDVDLSFLIIIFLFVTTNYDPELGWKYALLWAPVLFVSILVHELAHAATIAAFGFGTSHVVLGGMGGVTINERRAKHWQDMLISAAGPFSSFALAFIVFLIIQRSTFVHRDPMFAALMPMLLSANILWGLFNLLPVPPLDGGRALRNLLRIFLRERIAFVIAVWIAIVTGAAVAIWGATNRQYFLAAIMAWFAFNNFQAWEDYRHRGIPGD